MKLATDFPYYSRWLLINTILLTNCNFSQTPIKNFFNISIFLGKLTGKVKKIFDQMTLTCINTVFKNIFVTCCDIPQGLKIYGTKFIVSFFIYQVKLCNMIASNHMRLISPRSWIVRQNHIEHIFEVGLSQVSPFSGLIRPLVTFKMIQCLKITINESRGP